MSVGLDTPLILGSVQALNLSVVLSVFQLDGWSYDELPNEFLPLFVHV